MNTNFDIIVLVEVFLTEVSIELVQFPSNFFYFISYGFRDEDEDGGRAAGGILVMLRSDSFVGSLCTVVSHKLCSCWISNPERISQECLGMVFAC